MSLSLQPSSILLLVILAVAMILTWVIPRVEPWVRKRLEVLCKVFRWVYFHPILYRGQSLMERRIRRAPGSGMDPVWEERRRKERTTDFYGPETVIGA